MTAYEMRISDWSSDVCSSDLRRIVMHLVDQHTTTPAKSSRVPLKKTSINAKAMHTNRPSTKVGSASAKLGPMRSPISCTMSLPPSEQPMSKRYSGTELEKKNVSVTWFAPPACLLKNSSLASTPSRSDTGLIGEESVY